MHARRTARPFIVPDNRLFFERHDSYAIKSTKDTTVFFVVLVLLVVKFLRIGD